MSKDPAQSRIDDLSLFSGAVGQRAGAAFELPERPQVSATWSRGDGWEARISAASRYVVASGGSESDYPAVWRSGYAVVQEALDVWSARGVADLETTDPYGNHLAFWEDADGAVVRNAARAVLNVDVGVASVVVRDAAGNVKPQPLPPEVWHQSMRFFRQSQRTDDIFDSLRSLWLAVENLLDSVDPYQTGTDREESWLKRALKTAGQQVNLPSYLPPPSGAGTAKAAHNAAYEYFYDDLRTHLFHAKASRQPTLPHDPDGVRHLVERHDRLTRFYLDLLNATTGVRRMSGGMMSGGFDMATAGLENNPRVLATDDPAEFDPAHVDATPGGGHVVSAPAARDRSLDASFLRVYVGRIPGKDVEQLGLITRLMFEAETALVTAHIPEGALVLRGIDWLDVQMEVGMRNTRMPKSFTPA